MSLESSVSVTLMFPYICYALWLKYFYLIHTSQCNSCTSYFIIYMFIFIHHNALMNIIFHQIWYCIHIGINATEEDSVEHDVENMIEPKITGEETAEHLYSDFIEKWSPPRERLRGNSIWHHQKLHNNLTITNWRLQRSLHVNPHQMRWEKR